MPSRTTKLQKTGQPNGETTRKPAEIRAMINKLNDPTATPEMNREARKILRTVLNV